MFVVQGNGSSGNVSTGISGNIPPFVRLPYIMKASTNLSIPDGLILFWPGNLTTMPGGWLPCNGSLGTPDLIGRFVMGTNDDVLVGTTGGDFSHQHAYTDLPYHTHTVVDPGHSHGYSEPQVALSPTTGGLNTYRFLNIGESTITTASGLSVRETGFSSCVTDPASLSPPYTNLVPILKSTGTDLLPGHVIFMWPKDLHMVPAHTSLCDGSQGTPDLYGRFIRSASDAIEIGASGGSSSHRHTYSQVPRHAHASTEGLHSHTVQRQSDYPLTFIPDTVGTYISSYGIVPLQTSVGYAGVTLEPSGDVYCATGTVDHLPLYYTLAFLRTQDTVQQQAAGDENEPIQPIISLETGLAMAGVLGACMIISALIKRKKRAMPAPVKNPAESKCPGSVPKPAHEKSPTGSKSPGDSVTRTKKK
jgi:microcystin-dependent protein